jgi:hypothetical protein
MRGASTSRPWDVFAALYALSVLAAAPADVQGQDLRARFESEAPRSWAKIVEMSRGADVERVDTFFSADRVDQYILATKISGTKALSSSKYVRTLHNQGEERVICCNSKYGFELIRSAEDRPWSLSYIGKDVSDIFTRCVAHDAKTAPQIALCAGGFFLPDQIKQPTFKVLGVEAIEGPDGQLAAVRFENGRPEKKRNFWVQRGTLVLNPGRLWAIQRYNVDVISQPPGEARWWSVNMEFLPGPENFPIVREYMERQGPKGGAEDCHTSHVFNRFELRDVPESEFTLTAFGLPEMTPRSSSGTDRLLAIFVGTGVLCFIAAYFVRRRSAQTG